MAATRIQVCGRMAVTWHGERLEQRLPARQGRLLFAFLVVRRHRAVVRDEIEAALWDGGPPEGAASTVRALLSRLRRVLGAEALEGREHLVLRLPDGAFVDLEAALEAIHRAEALVAAGNVAAAWAPARVALHTADRGFLPGYEGSWVAEVRATLDDVRRRALECVVDIGLGLGGGEVASAERAARRLMDGWPFRESGYRAAMRAHAARGNLAEALLVHERLRTLLRDELGVAPSPETLALHARLLDGAATE